VTVIAAGFDSGRPSTRKDGAAAMPGGAPSGGLPAYRRPMTTPAPQPAGQRVVAPQTAAPAVNGGTPAPAAPSRPAPAVSGGGITVPPLPPIPGPVAGRRPLSTEDFEEELDIPEFLKQ
jgi:cell division protein FtsZ